MIVFGRTITTVFCQSNKRVRSARLIRVTESTRRGLPPLDVLGELLSEDQILGTDRRRRAQQQPDEPKGVQDQTHHDSHKPNHTIIMP
jgi:hypothetical protein